MLQKTKAIVINSIKYSDTSLIVNCYTKEYGIKTYMLKGILKSRKGNLKKAYFQPLTQLQIVAYHNNKGNLNSVKEAQISYFYQSLHSNIIKQSLVLFLSEILNAVLKEEESNSILFTYLETALIWLDTHDKIANFHLFFLLNLTKYLGFYPETTHQTDYFDMLEGKFVTNPTSQYYIKKPQITHFKTLLGTNFDALPNIHLTALQRQELLDLLLQYISLHLQTFKSPKSLVVLKELFR
ncbi:MAG TPA: DNA repair protein RecO [Lutibacter sp.]|nr:DNA repair protein RecO [Lutibacter sp.]